MHVQLGRDTWVHRWTHFAIICHILYETYHKYFMLFFNRLWYFSGIIWRCCCHILRDLHTYQWILKHVSRLVINLSFQNYIFSTFSSIFRGGEDDDFYARLVHKNYKIIRFDQSVSQYTMLKHQKATPSSERIHYLKSGYLRYDTDGFNSLVYQELEYKENDLYTKVLVEI
jgi:N-terminal domain of galactosyltransferase